MFGHPGTSEGTFNVPFQRRARAEAAPARCLGPAPTMKAISTLLASHAMWPIRPICRGRHHHPRQRLSQRLCRELNRTASRKSSLAPGELL